MSLDTAQIPSSASGQVSSLHEVINLVTRFQDPAATGVTPDQIKLIQRQLLDVQQSPFGWQVADHLLLSGNTPGQRFFGALTFTIKLNQVGKSLSEEALHDIEIKLIQGFVHLVSLNDAPFVLQKVCGSLVTYLFLPYARWDRCLSHLCAWLKAKQYMPIESLSIQEDLFHALPPSDLLALLTFATTLAENSMTVEHESVSLSYCVDRTAKEVQGATTIFDHAFGLASSSPGCFGIPVLSCYTAWLEFGNANLDMASNSLTRYFLEPLTLLTADDTYQQAAEFYADSFNTYRSSQSIPQPQLKELERFFHSEWAVERLQMMRDSSVNEELDDDLTMFGQMILSFCHYLTGSKSPGVSLASGFLSEGSGYLMDIAHGLTRTQNHASVDQGLSNAVVDFWEGFNISSPDESPKDERTERAVLWWRDHWLQTVHELCLACQLPFIAPELEDFAVDDPFTEFRTRARETVTDTPPVFCPEVLIKLVSVAIDAYKDAETQGLLLAPPQAESTGDDSSKQVQGLGQLWSILESTLRCVGPLLQVGEISSQYSDLQLHRLFSTSMMTRVLELNMSVPQRLRKQALKLMGECAPFFGRNPEFMVPALELLFARVQDHEYMEGASRTIFDLCYNNRTRLTDHLPQFMSACESFFASHYEAEDECGFVIGAVAAIIQALPREGDKLSPLETLLNTVHGSYQQSLDNPLVENWQAASAALAQLLQIAEGCKEPSHVVDLDLEDDHQTSLLFWTSSDGLRLQHAVLLFVRGLVSSYSSNGDVLDLACKFLSAGFREMTPGPFVFSPLEVSMTLCSVAVTNPRVDIVLKTATSLVSSKWWTKSQNHISTLDLLQYTCKYVDFVTIPSADPETAHYCLEFLKRVVEIHISDFLSLPANAQEMLLLFAINAIRDPEQLPKVSGAGLWSALLNARPIDPGHHQALADLTTSGGGILVQALIENFGGNAPRSALRELTEPMRKLTFQKPDAKKWIDTALWSPSFPSTRVQDAEKRRFSMQVVGLRGDKRTNSAVRDFWLLCRGTPAGYG